MKKEGEIKIEKFRGDLYIVYFLAGEWDKNADYHNSYKQIFTKQHLKEFKKKLDKLL